MRKIWIIVLLASVTACSKDKEVVPAPGHPQMHYTYIEATINQHLFYRLDIDGDGSNDFTFGTYLVGDPVNQVDKLQYYASSTVDRHLLNNQQDQSPVLAKGDRIGAIHNGYTWWQISAIVLSEKVTHLDGAVTWNGLWKAASHQYLPVQVLKGGKLYHGWVELSMNTTTGNMTVHRAAISKEEGREVKAGL